MGNRAIITTKDRDLSLYLHWNGGRDSVEGFLAYCDLRGFLPLSYDPYGWTGVRHLSISVNAAHFLRERGTQRVSHSNFPDHGRRHLLPEAG